MQDLQHADCTVTPQPQPTPHGGQDQLNKHHYDLPEYDEKPSLTELIEDSNPSPIYPPHWESPNSANYTRILFTTTPVTIMQVARVS